MNFEKEYAQLIGRTAYDEAARHYSLGYVDWLEEELRETRKENKKLTEKLHERFSGIKTKDKGDGMMEISFK